MTNYLIERVKFAKSSLSTSLKDDLISAGEPVVRQLITLLPQISSYVVISDILELFGQIGGSDAENALSTLLEDAPVGNLPKRLISQSCIRGLGLIANASSVNRLIKVLSYKDVELRYLAINNLLQIATYKPDFKNEIIMSFNRYYASETFEKPGKAYEHALLKLGQNLTPRSDWENKPKSLIIEPDYSSPAIPSFAEPVIYNPEVIPAQELKTEPVASEPQMVKPKSYSTGSEYSYLTEEEQKEILEKLLKSPDENEKNEIINKLGDSGNIQVIDELLTVIRSTESRKIKHCAVDAVLKIAPNDIKLRFLVLEYILDKRVIGQDEAKEALANALRIAQIGLKRGSASNKPIGSFLFIGPTGVGKTELAKALAEALYGNELQLIRLDMSEYTDLSDKNKLIGAPPGYAGCDEGGRLTQAVIAKPQSVVLFDEVEKAHPELFNLFLQMMDDGRLTDSKGITVSFKDTVILMTSNIGSQYILDGIKQELSQEEIKSILKEELKTSFKPEFLNRLNEYIIFKPLSCDELLQVLDLKLKPTANNLKEKYQLILEVTDKAKDYIIETTSKQEYGFSPRELNRIIDDEIVKPLSEKLLKMEISESYEGKQIIPRGSNVKIDLIESKLVINVDQPKSKEGAN